MTRWVLATLMGLSAPIPAFIVATAETRMPYDRMSKYAEYGYSCLMPSYEIEGMGTLLHRLASAHDMSFQWKYLDPSEKVVVIELLGHGARLFAVSMYPALEFQIDIRRYDDDSGYEDFAAKLNEDLVAELLKLPGVTTKWDVLPEHYPTTLPAANRAYRGTPPG